MNRALHLSGTVSLILCSVMTVCWLHSIGYFGSVHWIGQAHSLELSSADGVFGILIANDSILPGRAGPPGWSSWRHPMPANRDRASLTIPSFNTAGFGLHVVKTLGLPGGGWKFGGHTLLIVYFPGWLPVAALSILPVLMAIRFLRRRARLRQSRCASCGYDLRASPEVCPECGTVRPK